MGMKQQILAVIDDWIGQCNDDINHNLDRILDHDAERNLRELYDRKIQLTTFRKAFGLDIYNGELAFCTEMLAGVVEHICEMESGSE